MDLSAFPDIKHALALSDKGATSAFNFGSVCNGGVSMTHVHTPHSHLRTKVQLQHFLTYYQMNSKKLL